MGAASTPNSSSDSTTSSLSPSSHDFDTTTQAEVYPTIPEEEEEEPVVEPLYQTSMADVVKTAIENKGKIRALDKAKAKKEREEEKQRLKREKEEEKLRQKKEKEEEKLKAKREKEETKLKAEQEKEEKRLKAEHEKEENMLRAEQEKEENMMQRLKTEGKQTVVQIDAHVEGDAKNQASNVASHALNNITSGASSVLHYQGGVAATPSGSTINMTTGENNIGNSAVQDLPLIKEKVSHEMKNRVLNNKAKEKSEKDYEYHPTQTTEMALDETLKTTSSGPPSYMVSKEEDVDENIADKQYSPSSPIATEKTNGELKFPRMISEQVQSDKADTPTNIIRNSRSESDELSGKVNVKSPRSNEKSPDGVLQSMSSGGGPKGKSSSKGRSDSSDGKLMNEVSLTSGSNSFSATKKSKERSNVSRPSSKDRPSFSRPTSKERPGFSRPTSKERPGFSRPTSKERPGFSRPTSKERPGFSRPTSKERPGLSRPTSKDRPTLSRPTSKERPTKSGKSSRSASRDRSATMSQEKVPLESVKEAANESSHHHHKRQQKQRQSRPTSREPRSAESSKILKAQASERLHSGDLTLPPASSPKPAKMIRHSHTSTEFKPSFQEKQENQEDNVTTSSGPKTSVLENRENQEKNVAKLYKKLTGKNKESEMHVPETSKVIFNNDGVQSSLKTKDTEDNVYNTSRSLEPPKVQTSSTKDIIVKNIPSDTKTDEELNPVKSEEQELKSTNSENEGIKMTKSEEQELKNSAKGELVQKDDTHSNSSKMSSGSDTESHRSLVAITAEENLMYSRGQSPRPGSSFSQHSQSKSGDVQSTTKFHTQVIRSLKDNQSPYKMQPQVTKPPSSTDVTNGGTDRVRDKSVSQPAMSKPSPTGQSILRDGETGSVVVAAGGGQASAAPASALLEVEPGGGIVKNATSEVLKSSVQASDDVGRTIVIKPRGYEEPPVLKTIARSNHVLHTTSNTEGTGQTSTSSSTAAGPQNRSVREDVLVKGLEESVKYNSGDRISLSNSPGQNAMPYQVNPRGSTLSAVEVPEGTINTVSLAVSQGGSNPVRPIPVREHFSVPTSSIFDRKTSNPSFSGSSLWHKARPLVVRPSLDSYFREPREYEDFLPREPVRPVLQRRSSLGKIDVPDPYDDYYYDDYEDENARLDRLRESRGSQTVRVKNQQPRHSILKKTDYKPPPPPKKEDLRPLVLDKLEEYRNTPPIIIASGLVPKNLESLTSEYQAKNPDGGTHKNSTTTNDNTLANNYSNNQRTAANNRNNHQGSKDKDQNFQDLRYQHDLSSTQGAAITAPLVASQQKQNIGDVFNRLHNNRRAEQGLVAPKKSESKTKTKAIPGKASKDFGTAITTTFRGPAPEPQRRHQQNVGHDVFSRLYENRKRRNEMQQESFVCARERRPV
ncbi:hypothetical protein Pmani_018611 [Petrolisthes manimaculis]|uniref:Uncharacterized protein n=1 Tax=Petrolisthes manimaculis TaxID=1843537 RepID=A0AAE1PK06_9EUCA|nr:hypothetical protein Pmani_018611 [Petrolisthes manimaculis]